MSGAALAVLLKVVQPSAVPATELRFAYVDLELLVQTCAEGKQGLAGLRVILDAKSFELERRWARRYNEFC